MTQETMLSTGVYFIYAPNQNKIKIGRSVKIERRFKQLRTGFMDKGTLLFGILSENEVKLEKKLHQKFAHLRDNGEWFILTRELKEFILNIKLEYVDIVEYSPLNEIQSKLSYQSLGMFNFIMFLKNLQNKYLVPIVLAIAGLIISYYNYTLELSIPNNKFMQSLSFAYFLVFPIATPLVARQIIAYKSVLTGIFYFLLLFLTLLLEFTNLIFIINPTVLVILRIVILSIYIAFTKNILISIKAQQYNDNLNSKIKTEINELIGSNVSIVKLINIRESIISNLKKKYRFLKYSSYIISGLGYLFLNIFLFYFSECNWELRIINLIILDAGLLIWIVINWIVQMKNLLSDNLLKFKSFIIPVSLFLAFITTLGIFHSYKLFWEMNSIIIIGLLPYMIVSFFTISKIKKYKLQRKEIENRITNME